MPFCVTLFGYMLRIPTEKFHESYIPEALTGCWLWHGKMHTAGYGLFAKHYAHRLSYALHYGEFDKRLFVCHKCDVKTCVNPDHLFLGTHTDNMRDGHKKKRFPIGEKSHYAKLTPENVMEIRKSDKSAIELAKKFSLNRNSIYDIRLRRSWRHLD